MGVDSRMRSDVVQVSPKKESKSDPVDREKTCPMLLRVFHSKGRHNRPDDFARNQTPDNELQVYTWMDATLKEITNLVRGVNPETRKKGTEFHFAIVYQDTRMNRYRVKEIGKTISGGKSGDENISLQGSKFQIGDFMDIAIRDGGRNGHGSMRDDRRRYRPY